MRARIFQPPKSAMQSGRASPRDWVLTFAAGAAQHADPLMGWNGGGDTRSQVRLTFASKAEAIAYAERNGVSYEVEIPRERRVRPKAYADNFSYFRRENWTH